MDKLSKEARSRNMARIKSKNTKPELLLRRNIFSKGLRYRVHYRIKQTNVDIAFPKMKKAINVNGCFWHQHENCIEASKPKTNVMMWEEKLRRNLERDKRNAQQLREEGWKFMIVWECELEKNTEEVVSEIIDFVKGV